MSPASRQRQLIAVAKKAERKGAVVIHDPSCEFRLIETERVE
jgi:hypothetical protein